MKLSLFFCLLAVSGCFAQGGYKVHVENVAVMSGETATVPCTYELPEGVASNSTVNGAETDINPTITWYSIREQSGDEQRQRLWMFKKGDDANTFADSGANRKGLQIDDKDGSLIIPDTTTKDNIDLPKLRCRITFGQADEQEADLVFQVVHLPTQPATTTLYAYQDGQRGFEMTAFKTSIGTCEIADSSPEAKITFYKNGKSLEKVGDGGALNMLLDSTAMREGSLEGTTTTSKDLVKELDSSDHQAEFICNVEISWDSEGEKKFHKANYTMPKFSVNYETDSVSFEDEPVAYLGKTITLKCVANGFPEPTVMLNGEEVSEKTFEVTEDMDGQKYQCTAYNRLEENAVTSSEYTIKVFSLSEPVIEGNEQVQTGESVSVACSATGEPAPSIAWYKGDTKMSDSGTLNIEGVVFENSAEYTCRADNGHEELERFKSFELSVRGMILEGEEEVKVEGKKDESVTLECAVNSNPEATFTWSDSDAASSETKVGYTFTSSITVGPLTPELSEKMYTCTASNADGVTVTKTFKLPVISTSSGATAGIIIAILVVLLIVAIILAVLYNKGIICKKGEKGEESADEDIAVEINNDDADVEAGNGKATSGAEGDDHDNIEANEEEKLMNRENEA